MFLTKRSWPGTSTNCEVASVDRLVGEAEIDGDAARLLFLQPIGVGAGQRLHQRALAVVDVPARSDDDGLLLLCCADLDLANLPFARSCAGRCFRFLLELRPARLGRRPALPSRTRLRISTSRGRSGASPC
jgi:hypothetical protein